MIITLTGANAYALRQKLDQLVASFVAMHGDLAVERLDGQEAELGRLHEALTALPFLAINKLVVLRQPSANKQFTEQAEHIFGEVPDTTNVIVVEPKLDKRLAYYKFLKSQTDFRKFPERDTNGLAQWLSDMAQQQEGTLSPADARFLIERVGSDQQLLFNEITKLILFEPRVSRQSIEALTDPKPQSTIFQLLEAAFAGRTKTMLRLYAEQRVLKVEPPQIIAMLTWQLHVLAILNTAGDRSVDQIAKESRLNPFVVRKSQAIARQLSRPELKKLISDLLKIDVRSKRSGINADEALQHYLLTLAT
jgi:DNA polymerase-3 subunit delta